MKNKQIKKVLSIILIIIYLLNILSYSSFATTQITEANLIDLGDCGQHLQYWNESLGVWSYVSTTYVGYSNNGTVYPAYCLDVSKPGAEEGSYTVSIEELLDDVEIWRTITSGFPYKSAAELGLDSDYDAFVATKHAVYCILYNRDVRSYYKGADEVGEKIVDAIESMVNEGRYGTRTQLSANVTINEETDWIIEDIYAYKDFSVTSFVTMDSYNITNLLGSTENTIITNTNNIETTSFNGDENFRIQIPISDINDDLDMILNLRAHCETYPIFYGESEDKSLQDYAITFDPLGDEQAYIEFSLDSDICEVTIIKEDLETHTPIENVVFNISDIDGNDLGNYTTNSNGEIKLTNLNPGTVIITEIVANENYILDDTPKYVDLSYGDTLNVTLNNERKTGNLQITKIDADNNNITLGAVEFNLYSYELDEIIGTYTTDVDGCITIENLRVGEYSLIETKTNKWYNLSDDINLIIEWNTTNEIAVENELIKGQIEVIKVDSEDNTYYLENVKFGIYDNAGNLLETIVTNDEGKALTNEYALRDFEELTIVELETLEEYVLDSTPNTIILEENQIKTITFENEKIKGTVQINKTDEDNNPIELSNIAFGIYDKDNNLIETIYTDEKGIAISSDLYKGSYIIKELDTGSPYYLLNTTEYSFEINTNKEIVEMNINNEKVDIDVDVDKIGTIEIKPADEVIYEFSNIANNSNTYLENFKWIEYIPTDYIRVNTLETGIYNQDLNYSIYVKTNLSEEYVLFQENLSTLENNLISFDEIELAENEYIIEFYLDFGEVEKGFKETTSPKLNCISLENLENNTSFTNSTKTIGTYFDLTSESTSKWTTIVNIPEEPEKILPYTGK